MKSTSQELSNVNVHSSSFQDMAILAHYSLMQGTLPW